MIGIDMQYVWYVMIPGLIIGGLATLYTRSMFGRFARVGASSGMTGAEAAQRLLASNGVHDVEVEMTQGFLSDHYDPTQKKLRLSPDVFRSHSLSAIGVACHEAGHAIQHAHQYAPLMMRSALVPVTNIGSMLSYPIIFAGLFFRSPMMMNIGILLFVAVVAFTLITLPVEWDASARAKKLMVASGIVTPSEQAGAGAVLNAAFLTYVASTVSAILTLLYYLTLARGRD